MPHGRLVAWTLIMALPLIFAASPIRADESTGKAAKKSKSSQKKNPDTPTPLPPPSDKTWRGFSPRTNWHDLKQECLSSVKGVYLSAYDAHLHQEETVAPLKDNLKVQQELLRRKTKAIDAMIAELKREPYQAELATRLHDELIIKESMVAMLDQRKEEIHNIENDEKRLKGELKLLEEKIAKIFVMHFKNSSTIFVELRSECLRFRQVCDPVLSPEDLINQIFGNKTKETYCLNYLGDLREDASR